MQSALRICANNGHSRPALSTPEDHAPVLFFVHAGTPLPGKEVGSTYSETSYS
jgi:hypothetical protein